MSLHFIFIAIYDIPVYEYMTIYLSRLSLINWEFLVWGYYEYVAMNIIIYIFGEYNVHFCGEYT